MKQKVIYYTGEADEDFGDVGVKEAPLDKNYKYVNKNFFFKIFEFFAYRVFALFWAHVYCLFRFNYRIKNKKAFKAAKKSGRIVYMNHTLLTGDAFMPNVLNAPKKSYVIVSSRAVSIKGIQNFVKALGAVPLPDSVSTYRNFDACLKTRLGQKAAVVIYPEAHVWRYCPFIRPFKKGAFKYPARFGVPVFAAVNTFRRRKILRFIKTPQIVTIIGGPFYANENLEQEVFDFMNQTAEKYTTYRPIEYMKK